MTVEIRPATADEMGEFTRVATTALGVISDSTRNCPPEQTLCAFEDGRMATAYWVHPYTMYFNGKDAPVAGIGDVGTLPIYRRRGYLRQIVTTHFQQMHEQGERSIAILWPSQGGIYKRYGCAFVSTQYGYSIEPRYLQFAEPPPATGTFVEAGEQEADSLADLYHKFATGRTGYLHRSRDQWQRIMLGPSPQGRLTIRVMYVEGGTPSGYLVYTVESTGPGPRNQRVTVRQLVYLNMTAYHVMWEYLAGMDLISTITWPNVPQDDPLPHLLLDSLVLTPTSPDGLMGRIVDVARALPLRGYPVAARLTFEVRDELCSWNQGRWELETADGEVSVRRSNKSPQLVMPVSTLALLVFNYVSASQSARMGHLDVHAPEALVTWDAAMQTVYRPFCADHF